jgi:hypothetical protein
VFGVRQSLIADWVQQPDGTYLVDYDFVLERRAEGSALIRHIVLWNVRGDTREEKAANIARLQRSFEACAGRLTRMEG